MEYSVKQNSQNNLEDSHIYNIKKHTNGTVALHTNSDWVKDTVPRSGMKRIQRSNAYIKKDDIKKDNIDIIVEAKDKNDYSLEWSDKFIYKVESVNINFNKRNIKFDDMPSRPSKTFVDTTEYCNLITSKNQIDEYKKTKKMYLWNTWSKLVNPYEKIGSFSNISSGTTISRAYYKLYEILKIFDTKNIKNSLHLCEAPGGFIKATLELFPNVNWYAQTLYEGGGQLEVNEGLDPTRWIRNGTGDICVLANIKMLENDPHGEPLKYDLITGDGGFDVSFDPNNQEQHSFKLIYGEVLAALHCQNKGGTFVCKIFDSMTRPTCQLFYILSKYYESVYIVKPRSSRFSNSEKYIVAINFKEVPLQELEYFDNLLVGWDGTFCRNLGTEFSKTTNDLRKFNTFIASNQINYIDKAVEYSTSANKKSVSNTLETLQNKRALAFCIAFGLKNKEICDHKNIFKVQKEQDDGLFIYKCYQCLRLFVK